MIIGIDLSLRSTAICALDCQNNLIYFELIKSKPNEGKTKKEQNNGLPILNDEALLIYNAKSIIAFIKMAEMGWGIDGIAIEGLSFGSISGNKDIIQGNFWYVRTMLYQTFTKIPIGIIPVSAWRSKAVTKEEKARAKEKYVKDYLKHVVVDALPEDVRTEFKTYIDKNEYSQESLFDLADSYFLSKYRNSLS